MKLCLTCQTCYDDDMALCVIEGHPPLEPGRAGSRVVGRYRLDRLLGGGAMGTVYAGTHEDLDRQDAIKLLEMDFILKAARRANPHLLTDAQALAQLRDQSIKRFRLEARTAGKLTHQNLVRIYDHGLLSDDEGYISMELVEGQTLQQHIHDNAPLTYPIVISIARQIASGLSAAHRSKVIHRDLKPANIMIIFEDGELQVKVLDFGLAKLKEHVLTGGGLTAPGAQVGTPYYMSPEQCVSNQDLDERSDIYSFGVIMFEMLSGRRPFEGQNATAIAVKHVSEQPPELTTFRPDIPQALEKLVMQSLRKPTTERPQSMSEVIQRLREIEPQGPISGTQIITHETRDLPSTKVTLQDAETLQDHPALVNIPMGDKIESISSATRPLVTMVAPRPHDTRSKVRIYDLAKQLKLDTKYLIEEIRREGVDVSVPSNSISKELAEKLRTKYFPRRERKKRRVVKVVKKAVLPKMEDAIVPNEKIGDIDFGRLLDEFEREQRSFHQGDVVQATVVSITDLVVVVDFGYKSEGIVNAVELTENGAMTVKLGDEIRLFIKSMADRDGRPLLSPTNPFERKDVDFGELLDQFEREQVNLTEGELVRGAVVGISEGTVVIDFGYRSEGIVDKEEFTENGQLTVRPGDEVDVVVKGLAEGSGLVLLSRREALWRKSWDDLEEAYREGLNITGRVIERVKGGLRVKIGVISAFLPGSLVDLRPIRNLELLKNQEIEAKIIKLNRKRANVVLSRKAALKEHGATLDQILAQIEEGIVVEGQIKRLTDYGAFVDLGGIDGLLHISNMSWMYLESPSDLFRVGDFIQAKILSFDRDRERISLGYKQLLPDPWQFIRELYSVGDRVIGNVSKIIDTGVVVEFKWEAEFYTPLVVEGLLPISEMTHSLRSSYADGSLIGGNTIECLVKSIDSGGRRIILSMKDF